MKIKLFYLFLLFWLSFNPTRGQGAIDINPTISPASFTSATSITVTYDVTGTALESLNEAWIWVWIPSESESTNSKHNINPATDAISAAKFTKNSPSQGRVTFSITFKPDDFFTNSISTATQIGILLKAKNWNGGQTTDSIATMQVAPQTNAIDIKPTISPASFTSATSITVTYNVTGSELASLDEAWIWVWIPTENENTNSKHNINPATDAISAAKFTKNSPQQGPITFSITFKPDDFFTNSISAATQIGILLKAENWEGGKTTDSIATMQAASQTDAIDINPTISPASFTSATSITVTYDVTGTALESLDEAWIWAWIPTENGKTNSKHNINPATDAISAAKFTKNSQPQGRVTFSITFKPDDFFTNSISTATQIGILLKAKNWEGGKTTDSIATMQAASQTDAIDINPTISPASFTSATSITVTYDVTGTALESLDEAWIWVWIPTENGKTNSKHNIDPATDAISAAKFTKNSPPQGPVTFSITFKPDDFFTNSISSATQIGILLKAENWEGGKTTDSIATMQAASQTDAIDINPTISPASFTSATSITVTYDVTGSELASLDEAWIWAWIPTENGKTNSKHNIDPATDAISAAKFTKNSQPQGRVTFSITFTPDDFFTNSISSATQIGILLKAKNWEGGKTTDSIATMQTATPPQNAQKETHVPTVSPAFFTPTTSITITYDVTGTALASLDEAWIWVWIPSTPTKNSKYNINPATSSINPAKFTKETSKQGIITFSITFKPADFFTENISADTKIGVLLKAKSWAGGQTADFVTPFWDGSFQIRKIAPQSEPFFVSPGSSFLIRVESSSPATYQIKIDNVLKHTQSQAATTFQYTHTTTSSDQGKAVPIKIIATKQGTNTEAISSFRYLMTANSPEKNRKPGIIAGINYHADDPTQVTLCLWAPQKTSVYVQGDFSQWAVLPKYLMARDGEYFWITLTGLTSGKEYGYRYLINEHIYVADPFADKILDPDDQHIPSSTYPNLMSFPEKALRPKWYFNRVSVFQTAQQPYAWKVPQFERGPAKKLVIYELLIHDFFERPNQNYQSLIDTISYFKRLGINAIELMPITEFNGNQSWGYNPTFMFAPDKYYGTKNKLKEFIDLCHENKIAVILDMVMNHQDIPNPMVLMDFDFSAFKPTSSNKWFNPNATHPYNVFFDMDHESRYTQKLLDTINHYWLTEYKFDGLRFDLSKGFTQKQSGNNVGSWSSYDADRIRLLTRMKDKIRSYSSDSYLILEHFGDSREEKELASKGFLLWGNRNHGFAQSTMGHASNSSTKNTFYKNLSWSTPSLINYMESHDEERLMYKNITYGNSKDSYSVKSVNIALERTKSAATYFLAIPGPKMIWQFGELGYDLSINRCENGSVRGDCRTSPKPPRWNYLSEPTRRLLWQRYRDMLHLHQYPIFHTDDAVLTESNLVKYAVLKGQPYQPTPTSANEMNAVVVANFKLEKTTVSIPFPHSGTWYNYLTNQSLQVSTTSPTDITLDAGQAALFLDFSLKNKNITHVDPPSVFSEFTVYPNPTTTRLFFFSPKDPNDVILYNATGQPLPLQWESPTQTYIGHLPSGLYILQIRHEKKYTSIKFYKK